MTDSSDGDESTPPVETDDVEQLLDELESLEETAEFGREQHVIRRAISVLGRVPGRQLFGRDDLAQQVVGGFLLSAPFVVTEEVWSLAAGMNPLRAAVTALMVAAIGYGTLYGADEERDPDTERAVLGVPVRFLSLLAVSYLSVATLALVFDAPTTFGVTTPTTLKAVSIGAIFSVVGAATADSLFG